MRALRPHPRFRSLLLSLPLLALTLMGSCTDGRSPLDASGEGVPTFLALNTQFAPALAMEATAPIVRIRVVAKVFGGTEILGSTELTVDPNASSWDVGVEVKLPPGLSTQVELTVELLNSAGMTEWSGHVGPLSLRPGDQPTVPNVSIVRGPLDNLSVTAVVISGAPAELQVGHTATLTGTASTSASSQNPQIYWVSLDAGVASVTPTGVPANSVTVTGLTKGTARIVATAGAKADTATIEVKQPLGSVTISPTQASATSLGQTLTFTAQVKDIDGNVVAGETVTWSVEHPSILTNLGNGSFMSHATGTTTVTATSTSATNLFATASVTVTQVPVSVEVTPGDAELAAFDDTQQFSAQAFDANDNAIPGILFGWDSGDDMVATVNQSGLATAVGNGTASITAEAYLASAAGPQQGGTPTGVKGSAELVVQQQPHSVVVTPESARIAEENGTQQFEATAKDANGHAIEGLGHYWTSTDHEVATVDSYGLATAVGEGSTTIKAQAWVPGTAPAWGSGAEGPQLGNPSGVFGEATLVVEYTNEPGDYMPLAQGNTWNYLVQEFYGESAPGGPTASPSNEYQVAAVVGALMAMGGFNWFPICSSTGLEYQYGLAFWDPEICDLWRATALALFMAGDLGVRPVMTWLQAPLQAGHSWTFTYTSGEYEYTDVFTIMALLQTLSVNGVIFPNVIHLRVDEGGYHRVDVYFARGVGIIRMDFSWLETGDIWYLFRQMTLLNFILSNTASEGQLAPTPTPFMAPGTLDRIQPWTMLGAFKPRGGDEGGGNRLR